MSKRPRDYQRSRVYKWERAALPDFSDRSLSLEQCGQLALTVARTFRRRAPRIHDGRGHRNAVSYGGCIALPRWARTRPVVLHEMAHELVKGNDLASHGPEFVGTYIALLHRFHGCSVRMLLASATDCRVDVSTPWILNHGVDPYA